MELELKVIIRCLVYNHEPYLRDCLDGFVMQKTNFPFKAVVHDDCSTDGSAAIIREYAEKYPDIIEAIYETENQYSKADGSLGKVMNKACNGRSLYVAYCEGDDYWVDPHKLQKQADFMDAHPECSMVCCSARIETTNGFLTSADLVNMGWFHYEESRFMKTEDVISKGGWFIHSCSIMRKGNLMEDYPFECVRCSVGDYPMQIFAALKGKIYYMHEKMVVYRHCSVGSWTSRQQKKADMKAINIWLSIVNMLESLDKYSKRKYSKIFKKSAVETFLRGLRDNQHLMPLVCGDEKILKMFSYQYMVSCFELPRVGTIKAILLKLKYFPFYPYHFVTKELARSCSLLQRIKIAWNYMFK